MKVVTAVRALTAFDRVQPREFHKARRLPLVHVERTGEHVGAIVKALLARFHGLLVVRRLRASRFRFRRRNVEVAESSRSVQEVLFPVLREEPDEVVSAVVADRRVVDVGELGDQVCGEPGADPAVALQPDTDRCFVGEAIQVSLDLFDERPTPRADRREKVEPVIPELHRVRRRRRELPPLSGNPQINGVNSGADEGPHEIPLRGIVVPPLDDFALLRVRGKLRRDFRVARGAGGRCRLGDLGDLGDLGRRLHAVDLLPLRVIRVLSGPSNLWFFDFLGHAVPFLPDNVRRLLDL